MHEFELLEFHRPVALLISYSDWIRELSWNFNGKCTIQYKSETHEPLGSLEWTGTSPGRAEFDDPGGVLFALRKIGRFGKALKGDEYFRLAAPDNAWRIPDALPSGYSIDGVNAKARFSFRTVETGSSDGAIAHAFIYGGLDFDFFPHAFPTHGGYGFSVDGLVSTFFGQPTLVRRIDLELPKDSALILVGAMGRCFSDDERLAIYYTLSLLSGRLGALYAQTAIDSDGNEIARVLTEGIATRPKRVAPINLHTAEWAPILEALPTMLDNFLKLKAEGIRIDAALWHLLGSHRSLETEIRDMTLALSALFESDAFARTGAKLLPPETYVKLLEKLIPALEAIVTSESLDKTVAERLAERLNAANDISHAARRKAFWDRVGFRPTKRDRVALKHRHPMSHVGVIEGKEWDDLIADVQILKNLIHRVIFSLLGYRGHLLDNRTGRNADPITFEQCLE